MEEHAKFAQQDSQYEFPYHYLPSLEQGTIFRLHRQLEWGLDYMTYMSYVVEFIRGVKPASLCDVGCGDGRLLQLVKSFVPQVTGIDLSERAIAFARAFNPEVEVLCGDIADLNRQFQVVTLVEVLEHIPDRIMADFVGNVAKLLAPNGHLLVSVPTVNIPLNQKHFRHYNEQLLIGTLAPHFAVENMRWLYRRSYRERMLRKILYNRFYLLNSGAALAEVWKMHKRSTYYADSSSGSHLVCLARPL